ncbi:uncharacterized protein LOC129940323 [Eupeodes corollae]|uniref:uncharacterized protein LOC129940323 n=1 Tax=Eupeodes corollae TaxID=290404 RepID=UPI002490773A|nr:uncharacterized protein LOC129940323 [Eupeodes corollae]
MKLLIVVLAISSAVSAERIDVRAGLGRSISTQAIDALEKLREQMPCGFPKYGIPPLAPFKVQHKELALKTDSFSVDGEVNEARIDGLDSYKIEDLRINIILSKVTFKLVFPSIKTTSLYDLETLAKAFGFTLEIKGKGNFLLELKDLEISGTIKYSILGGIKLRTCTIKVLLGDVESKIDGILGDGFGNRKMNELIEEMISLAINDNQGFITDKIEEFTVKHVNEAAEGYTLADIIGIIGGGGEGESEKCIPPEDN